VLDALAPNTPNAGETGTLTLRIRDVGLATARTRIIRLDLDGRRFDYEPGQAVFIGGKNEKPSAYSITVPPEEAHRTGCLEILVRVDRCGRWATSELMHVAGPVGHFTLPAELDTARRLVFIAGGAGIAPLRSMLRRAVTIPGGDIEVLYSARTPDDFPYESELRSMARTGRIRLWQTVTRDHGVQKWTGSRGRINEAVLEPYAADPDALFFVCGPLTFVACAQQILERAGVGSERIRTDRW
jgi:ferredoxin-NADP reductase